MDAADHLSNYDRQRVCVPQVCDCNRENCRYLNFLEECAAGNYSFQICNHNLVAASSTSLAFAFRRKLAHSAAAPFPTKAERRFRGGSISTQNFWIRHKRERTGPYWSGSLSFMSILLCVASNLAIRRLISCSISLFFVHPSYSAMKASLSNKI